MYQVLGRWFNSCAVVIMHVIFGSLAQPFKWCCKHRRLFALISVTGDNP